MLYHLFHPLRHWFIGFNLTEYITVRAAGAAVLALFVSFFVGPKIIEALRKKQIGEVIRSDGPETHHKKAGTPTMGGLIILCSILVPELLFARLDNVYTQLMIGATLWMGAVGFLDDYLKVVKKYPKGLIGRYKLLGQLTWGLVVGAVVMCSPEFAGMKTSTMVPFFKNVMFNLGIFYIPMVVLLIAGTSNAVNLTDGLDGLAIGLVGIAALAFAGMSYVTGRVDFSRYLSIFYFKGSGELTVYCASLIGAALGFLWFNSHPASVFMGDTGALALGGALGTLSVLLKKEILLLIVGGVFWIENISVILQVASYKWRGGKRIFRMAPLHHHFELLGWAEEKIVVRFWIVGSLLALLSLGTFKIR
jgi:phospho-N-acetylmuramoyl-pentapeptide-transferase